MTLTVTPRPLSWANWEHGRAVPSQEIQETFLTAPQPPKPHPTLPTPGLPYLSWVPSARPATKT